MLEFCKNNCLWALLQDLRIPLSWEKRYELAIGVAKGMQYLHSFSVPVLHRDLKSLNVLLDEYYTPKIADFGWTRLLAEKMTLKVGTFQWMAPEVIVSKHYTEKADVYSFGIILWEIASREPPFKSWFISAQRPPGERRGHAERPPPHRPIPVPGSCGREPSPREKPHALPDRTTYAAPSRH